MLSKPCDSVVSRENATWQSAPCSLIFKDALGNCRPVILRSGQLRCHSDRQGYTEYKARQSNHHRNLKCLLQRRRSCGALGTPKQRGQEHRGEAYRAVQGAAWKETSVMREIIQAIAACCKATCSLQAMPCPPGQGHSEMSSGAHSD